MCKFLLFVFIFNRYIVFSFVVRLFVFLTISFVVFLLHLFACLLFYVYF